MHLATSDLSKCISIESNEWILYKSNWSGKNRFNSKKREVKSGLNEIPFIHEDLSKFDDSIYLNEIMVIVVVVVIKKGFMFQLVLKMNDILRVNRYDCFVLFFDELINKINWKKIRVSFFSPFHNCHCFYTSFKIMTNNNEL